ncbi:MAG: hypothetical protein ACI8Q1_000245 [Parvicella sp.]|jgi:hypothetical protein
MKKYKLKSGNILEVIQDGNAESPDTWENTDMFLVYDHRQFSVKRDGFEPSDIYDYLEIQSKIKSPIGLDESQDELEDELNRYFDYDSKYFIFPVYAYIHSGVSLSLNNGTCSFDTSSTGYLLVKIDESKDESDDLIRATEYAQGLIDTWNQYLSGDVYGFRVMKPIKTYTITEEELDSIKTKIYQVIHTQSFISTATKSIEYEETDSCWGFYGDDPKTNGMMEHITDELLS